MKLSYISETLTRSKKSKFSWRSYFTYCCTWIISRGDVVKMKCEMTRQKSSLSRNPCSCVLKITGGFDFLFIAFLKAEQSHSKFWLSFRKLQNCHLPENQWKRPSDIKAALLFLGFYIFYLYIKTCFMENIRQIYVVQYFYLFFV